MWFITRTIDVFLHLNIIKRCFVPLCECGSYFFVSTLFMMFCPFDVNVFHRLYIGLLFHLYVHDHDVLFLSCELGSNKADLVQGVNDSQAKMGGTGSVRVVFY